MIRTHLKHQLKTMGIWPWPWPWPMIPTYSHTPGSNSNASKWSPSDVPLLTYSDLSEGSNLLPAQSPCCNASCGWFNKNSWILTWFKDYRGVFCGFRKIDLGCVCHAAISIGSMYCLHLFACHWTTLCMPPKRGVVLLGVGCYTCITKLIFG